jgi:hypothetical protein
MLPQLIGTMGDVFLRSRLHQGANGVGQVGLLTSFVF